MMRLYYIAHALFQATEHKLRSRFVGFMAQSSAVALLLGVICHGLWAGGHLDYDGSPFTKVPGQFASFIGLAADDIKMSGLTHHEPEAVLAALDVKPGGSLIGFDAATAAQKLENLDWVKSVKLQRLFPNQLEISILERAPLAVWQKDGAYFVIDEQGSVMASLAAGALPDLPLVTGPGADHAAFEFVNQLEANPDLSSRFYAAARVGKRRWNLYLKSGLVALLPEQNVPAALTLLEQVGTQNGLFDKTIQTVDLRFAGKVIIGQANRDADVITGTTSKPK